MASDPRAVLSEVLSEYQERANSARFYTRRCGWHDDHVPGRDCTCPPASPRIPLTDMIEYSDRMVAALRAVLAYADSIDHPNHGENAEREQVCDTCRIRAPFRGGAYWPCVYRRHAEEIRAAITEALGGTDA